MSDHRRGWESSRLKRFSVALAILWTAFVAVSVGWQSHRLRTDAMDQARIQAREAHEKDLVYRLWNAETGAVYVPITDKIQPNPYLKTPNRDVVTTGGLRLTLINPAYMTRMVHGLQRQRNMILGHITSLQPIRPENAPDSWETAALNSFIRGEKEYSSVEIMDGKPFMRLMRPLITEESCLKCHSAQGYKVGSIRGGISEAVPMEPIWAAYHSEIGAVFAGCGTLWLLGLGALGIGTRQLTRSWDERDRTQGDLEASRARYQALFEHSPISLWEGDFSTVKNRLDELRESGIDDFQGYFEERPEELSNCVSSVKILDANQASLNLYKAKGKQALSAGLPGLLSEESSGDFKKHVLAIAEGRKDFQTQSVERDFQGERIDVFLKWSTAPGFEETYSRVLVSVVDLTERNQMERALQESEQLLSDIFAHIQDGISFQDSELTIVRVNPAIERWFPHSMPLVGKKCFEAYHKRKTPCVLCPSQKAIATGLPCHEVVPKIGPGGETVGWFEIHSFPMLDQATGKPKGVIEYAGDITERKRAEDLLQVTLARLSGLINAIPDLVFFKDLDGRLLIVNKACEDLIGLSQKDIIGKTFFELIPGDLGAYTREGDDTVVRTRGLACGEHSTRGVDGKTRWFDTVKFPIVDEAGHFIGLGGVSRDITKRKCAEEELKASEATNRLLIDESPIGIGIIQNDRVAYVNPALRTLVGGDTLSNFVGQPVEQFIASECREMILQRRADRLTGRPRPPYFETKGLKESGEAVDLAVWPKETTYQGQPALLFFAVDITEPKALREQILQARKMEPIGTLTGGIAHEFNNLLAIESGFTDILLSEKEEGDPDYPVLRKIAASCARGAELVRKLRFLGRSSDSRMESLNLNHEVNETVKLISRTLPTNVVFDLKLDACLQQIKADASQVAQIIVNLVLNAVDAMPDGGSLTIETNNCALDAEYCRTHPGLKADDYVQLIVSDTGHGMDEATLSRIFEPFFTTRGLANRSGLGLAVVHGIIEEHGGHIECESSVDQGTTFRIHLPAMPETAPFEPVPEQREIRGGTETVLVVEDEELVRDLVAGLFENAGYQVLTASDGREALDLYSKERGAISLIILDLIMPHMGGRECLTRLLEIDPQSRILIMTGYSDQASKDELLKVGAKAFLTKPFEVNHLLRTVREILDQD